MQSVKREHRCALNNKQFFSNSINAVVFALSVVRSRGFRIISALKNAACACRVRYAGAMSGPISIDSVLTNVDFIRGRGLSAVADYIYAEAS